MKLSFELNKARKLSDEDIRDIIKRWLGGDTESGLSRAFSVSRNTIRHHRLRVLEPKTFREMERRKIERNKNYRKTKARKDYLARLRKGNGNKNVIKYRADIEKRTRNKEKRLNWSRIYREKNRKRINENWMKNYYRRLTQNILL